MLPLMLFKHKTKITFVVFAKLEILIHKSMNKERYTNYNIYFVILSKSAISSL